MKNITLNLIFIFLLCSKGFTQSITTLNVSYRYGNCDFKAFKCEGKKLKISDGTWWIKVPTGVWKYYFSNGRLQAKGSFLSKNYLSNNSESIFRQYKEYTVRGARVAKKYTQKDGKWQFYYNTGNLKEEITYKEDVKNGAYKSYYKNNTQKEVGQFKKSKKEGEWKEYEENGNFSIGDYQSNEKKGTWKSYRKSGTLKKIFNWQEGKNIDITREYLKNIVIEITISDSTIYNNFKQTGISNVNYELRKIVKSEYEKEAAFQERYSKAKSKNENTFTIDWFSYNYVFNNFKLLNYKNRPNCKYDSENQVLQLTYEGVKPFLIKIANDKVSKFLTEVDELDFQNLKIDICDKDNFKIDSGKIFINQLGETFDINNNLTFSINSINKNATKIFKKSTQIEIFAEIEYYENSDESDLFISKNDTYLKDYLKIYGDEIDNNRKRKFRLKKEFESLNDYQKAISLNLENRKFNEQKLTNLFFINNPSFSFMDYTSQEYDAENEIFKITYDNFGTIFIPVPISDAPKFGNKLKNRSLKTKQVIFTFINDSTIILKKLSFTGFYAIYNAFDKNSFKNKHINSLSGYPQTKKYEIPLMTSTELFNLKEKEKEKKKIINDVPFAIIEDVPVYPGCIGTNQELKKCLKTNINNHVSKKFDVNLAFKLGLSPGIKKIFVLFKIDKTGYITDVVAHGSHKSLEEEGIRVVKLLPKMEPGKQRGKPVSVKYTLPIVFSVPSKDNDD